MKKATYRPIGLSFELKLRRHRVAKVRLGRAVQTRLRSSATI